jgi:hypothetical protein
LGRKCHILGASRVVSLAGLSGRANTAGGGSVLCLSENLLPGHRRARVDKRLRGFFQQGKKPVVPLP